MLYIEQSESIALSLLLSISWHGLYYKTLFHLVGGRVDPAVNRSRRHTRLYHANSASCVADVADPVTLACHMSVREQTVSTEYPCMHAL